MIKTKEDVLKEFEAVVSYYSDDVLFALEEYSHIMPISDLAMYLVRAFKKMVWEYANELEREEEES